MDWIYASMGAAGELVERVRDRARRVPNSMAVSWSDGSLSVGDLVRSAEGLAARMLQEGVLPGNVVAFPATLSGDAIPVLLGCWWVGATPWLFDPDTPPSRLQGMFEHARPAAIVLPPSVKVGHHVDARRIMLGSSDSPRGRSRTHEPTSDKSGAGYLLFTSGSTGEPKAVLMPMESLESLARWQAAHQGPGAVGQFASRTFDVALQEIATGLWTGAEIVVFSQAERRDPQLLASRIARSQVETLFLPTAALHGFCESLGRVRLPSLLRIIVAGEQLRISEPVRAYFALNSHCSLHNQYGPTETHVVTEYVLSGSPSAWPVLPPIGRALPDVRLEVRVEDPAVSQTGIGDLVVVGPRVASGYYLDGRVAESGGFTTGIDGRSYATGDLVRWDGDDLVYVGRVDSQVKIRGHRVVPGEVESVVERHPEVLRCAVAAVDCGSHSELAAYVITDEPPPRAGVARMVSASLVEWCQRYLPEAMVPTIWLRVGEFPMTDHGKLDRPALPNPPRSRPETLTRVAPPTTRTERVVAEIWSRVLDIDEVGVMDDFGSLGGTSLHATRILAALRAELAPEVRAIDVFAYPTVRGFSSFHDSRDRIEITTTSPEVSSGRIAIVGMACRFPGANDLRQFWANLVEGRESITRGLPDRSRPHYVAAAGRITDVGRFDANYFDVSGKDAARIDPQHRMFLELTVSAFEDAGVPSAKRRGTGVFAGCGPSTYLLNNLLPALAPRPKRNLIDSVDELELLMGNDKDYVATRVSYALDLHGPAFSVVAACATGLVAVDAARRALLSGSCDYAIAGAVSLSTPEVQGYEYESGLMYSPDGCCRPFSADAAGTVFSAGGGVVLLCRLEDALADACDIYAVIEGSAVGNDGRRKIGMTAPSAAGQAEVIRRAWQDAGVVPQHVRMVEGHGTATQIGDAVEVEALTMALGDQLPRGSCALGSVKSNIGHLGWAAGMAGLIKTALAVSHGVIPSTLHCESPAESLAVGESGFYLPTKAVEWEGDAPRVAGVSSFGLGGANAHVVVSGGFAGELEKGDTDSSEPHQDQTSGTVVYPISAKSRSALKRLATATSDWLRSNNSPAAVAATTAARFRDHDAWRMAVVGSSREELADRFELAPVPGAPTRPPSLGFVFTGQGFEYFGMGRTLYSIDAAFRGSIDNMNAMYRDAVGEDLREVLGYAAGGGVAGHRSLSSIAVAQPALYCFQLALADMWSSFGVRATVAIGHSLGEFAAAATAGVFSRGDGLFLVAERGRLLSTLPEGVGMLAVRASVHVVETLITEESLCVEVAAVNSLRSITVAGTDPDLDRFSTLANAMGIDVRRLPIRRAGHSSHIDPIVQQFGEAFEGVALSYPTTTLISNLTGAVAGLEVCRPEYWQRQLRETVMFGDGIKCAREIGVDLFLEISARPTLTPLVDSILDSTESLAIPSMTDAEDDDRAVGEAMASLYEAGVAIQWDQLWWITRSRARIPTYQFDGAWHWIGPLPEEPKPAESLRVHEAIWRPQSLGWKGAPRRWLLVALPEGLGGLVGELTDRGHVVETTDFGGLRTRLERRSSYDELVVWGTGGSRSAADLEPAVRAVLQLALDPGTARLTMMTWSGFLSSGESAESDTQWVDTALVGLVRVCATEGTFTKTRVVDAKWNEELAAIAEVLESQSADVVALRDGECLAPVWQAVDLPMIPLTGMDNGIHLVVGGTRGLGLWTCEQLAAAGGRHFLLVGRSSPSSAAVARIEALREKGVRVDVLSLDVRDTSCIGALDEAIAKEFLAGVVYSAGVVDDALVTSADWPQIQAVLSTKLDGFANVARLLEGRVEKPGYVLIYSSIAATLGTVGQSGHAAANYALNVAAKVLRMGGVNATSVGWGPWSDHGFLHDQPRTLGQLIDAGLLPMTSERAARLLGPLIATSRGHVDLLDLDWSTYQSTLSAPLPPRFDEVHDDLGSVGAESAVTVASGVDANADPTTMRQVVLGAIAHRLGRQPRSDRSLSKEGFDSLNALRLRNTINRELGLSVRTVDLTSAVSIDEMIESLQRNRDELNRAHLPSGASAEGRVTQSSDVASHQQRRWRSLVVNAQYGHRVVPIFFPFGLDGPRLRNALLQVVGRHDSLRTVFPAAGRVETVTAESAVPSLAELVVERGQDLDARAAISSLVHSLRSAPPDVATSVSWTCRALDLGSDEFVLLLSLQHLELDGTSLSIFLDELMAAYTDAWELRPEPLSYVEYTSWQSSQFAARSAEAIAFVQGLFAQVTTTTVLPGRLDLAVTSAPASSRYTPAFDECLGTQYLVDRARQIGASPFSLVAAAFGRAVAEQFGLREITITSILSGRSEERFDQLVGPLTSPWPLPVPLAPLPLVDAARVVSRTTIQLAEFATFCSGEALALAVPAFAGLPADTYFSDVAINFLNYERLHTTEPRPLVVEVLGPVDHPLLVPGDFAPLAFPSGLHLIVDLSTERAIPSLWFHRHRFTPELAEHLVRSMTHFLKAV